MRQADRNFKIRTLATFFHGALLGPLSQPLVRGCDIIRYFPSLAHGQRARWYWPRPSGSLPVGPWGGASLTPVTAANP